MILKRNKPDDKFLRWENFEQFSLRKVKTPLSTLFRIILILYKA